MNITLRHKLLTYLAGVAIALTSGNTADARLELTEIPEPVMVELLDNTDEEDWQERDLVRLAGVLAHDPRSQVRRRIVGLLAKNHCEFSTGDLEPVLANFARDEDPVVRSEVAEGVAEWLPRLDGFDRARVVLEWALSDSAAVRQIIATALSYGTAALGADLAIEHLSRDEDHDVRLAVVEAAQKRYAVDPVLFSGILRRLTSDGSRRVRKAARRAAVKFA